MKRCLSLLVVVSLAATLFGAVTSAGAVTASAYRPPDLKVAVVSSAISQDWLNRHHSLGYGLNAVAWRADAAYDWLDEHGWDVTKVDDSVFNSVDSLKEYDVVVLPFVFCMDPTPSANLQKYVADGGGVVGMLGSPRIAPRYDTGPTTEKVEHWYNILFTGAMEWGPMSEVYQMNFVDDPGAPKYKAVTWPYGNQSPVIAGARNVLSARGLSTSNLTLDRSYSGAMGGGFELTELIKGNNNVQPIYSIVDNDFLAKKYPGVKTAGTYPAAVSTRYQNGRGVYFDFSVPDFLGTGNGDLGGHKASNGVAQRDIAGAMMESSIAWAGSHDDVKGTIDRDGRTWGEIKVYNDGIYAFQYMHIYGNVGMSGVATFKIYDPSGKLVSSQGPGPKYVGSHPGGEMRWAYSYRPGPLKNGKYRVEVEYVFGYPQLDHRYKEVAYVVRGQGVGIRTKRALPAASKAPTISRTIFAPDPISPNGDRWMDSGLVTYSNDQPAQVSLKVYTLGWKLVSVGSGIVRDAGRHGVGFNGKNSKGAVLAPGAYRYVIVGANERGTGSAGGIFYISPHLGKATALPAVPAITNVAPTGTAAAPAVSFNLSAVAWTTVKVFSSSGAEVATLANNGRVGAGDRTFTWNGRDGSGRVMPDGTYRFYVFISSGGTSPTTAMKDGTFTLSH